MKERTKPAVLFGTAAAAGRASGRARILSEDGPSAVSPGEVLVVQSFEPAHSAALVWASALVVESGRLPSSAAVVARELRIPAVIGIAGASRHISNGMSVVVDGSRGSVSLG